MLILIMTSFFKNHPSMCMISEKNISANYTIVFTLLVPIGRSQLVMVDFFGLCL
jgi:hypothetical protein